MVSGANGQFWPRREIRPFCTRSARVDQIGPEDRPKQPMWSATGLVPRPQQKDAFRKASCAFCRGAMARDARPFAIVINGCRMCCALHTHYDTSSAYGLRITVTVGCGRRRRARSAAHRRESSDSRHMALRVLQSPCLTNRTGSSRTTPMASIEEKPALHDRGKSIRFRRRAR